MIWLLASPALATTPVLGVAGGFDLPTEEPWVGFEAALHPDNTKGFAPVARLDAAWGFGEGRPMFIVDAGFSVVIPEDEAVVRLGALVRPVMLYTETRLPLQLGDPTEGPAFGLAPSAQALIEFEWKTGEAPITAGVRGGIGSFATDITCDINDPDPARCISWYPGFAAGFVGRKRFENGLSVELIVGTTSSLTIGRAL